VLWVTRKAVHGLREEGRWSVKIDTTTRLWVVSNPTPHSILPDVCFETTLDGLRLQFAGGLSMDDPPAVFRSEEEAHEEAKNRLLVWRIASRIRIGRRVPESELVRVTPQDKDGTVLFEGEGR
jgi:hypothetical protein